jgi:hypothetical protein
MVDPGKMFLSQFPFWERWGTDIERREVFAAVPEKNIFAVMFMDAIVGLGGVSERKRT